MTDLEQLNKVLAADPLPPGFKPTHATTYGENEKGHLCSYYTDLVTGKTEITILGPKEWSPKDIELWTELEPTAEENARKINEARFLTHLYKSR